MLKTWSHGRSRKVAKMENAIHGQKRAFPISHIPARLVALVSTWGAGGSGCTTGLSALLSPGPPLLAVASGTARAACSSPPNAG